VIARASRAAGMLAGLATLAVVLLISYDVLMRYFFDQPQLFVDELASFLEVFIIFGGLAWTFNAGGHIRIDLVTAHLRGPARAWLRVVTLTIGMVLLALVMWVTAQSALTAYRYGRVSSVMLYPLWAPMLFIPAGLGLMSLAMLVTLVRQLRAVLGPRASRDEVAPLDGVRE
jgi:TRAP-type C4-dicarboxylate transport system permease small subunit